MSDQTEEESHEDKANQTRLQVFPHLSITEDDPATVICERACQTAVSAFPELENQVFYSLLRFIPYKNITKDAIKEVDLPRKQKLQFKLPDDSPSDLPRGNREQISVQTELTVVPHILEEHNLAKVYEEASVQTSITFEPTFPAYNAIPMLKKKISHEDHTGIRIPTKDIPVHILNDILLATVPNNENNLIDSTAHSLANASDLEDHMKTLLKFTASVIATEISKIKTTFESELERKPHCSHDCSEKRLEERETAYAQVQTGSICQLTSEYFINRNLKINRERGHAA